MIAVKQSDKDILPSAKSANAASDSFDLTDFNAMGGWLYRICYMTGMYTIRVCKRSSRRLSRFLRPIGRKICRLADTALWQRALRVAAEGKRFLGGFPMAADRVKTAWQKNPLKAVGQALLLPFLAMRRHRRALFKIGRIMAPVGAVALLIMTVQFWTSQHFALVLEVGGQEVGYIQDESVLGAASALAEDRVSGGRFEWAHSPRLSIAIADEQAVMSEEDLCNELLKMSGDSVAQMYGLYIDGEFEGAMLTHEGVEQVLETLKSSYAADEDATATILQNVEIKEALYPVSSWMSSVKMTSHLKEDKTVTVTYTAQLEDTWDTIAKRYDLSVVDLQKANPDLSVIKPDTAVQVVYTAPRIQVQVEKDVTHTEEVMYDTVTKKTDDLYLGQTSVSGGEYGKKTVTSRVVTLNGEVIRREVIAETVVKEPVDKVVLEGTKTISGLPSQNKGSFIWPVPICHNISRGVSYGHNGLDICNGPVTVNNQPFVASAAGTVVEASYGWNGGYGNMVLIDHGNGYTSYYAHCNSLAVVPGQKVNAGDMLGLIGNTGASDGPHLHFEIRYNGVPLDPYRFF